jgi:hypothetical protein
MSVHWKMLRQNTLLLDLGGYHQALHLMKVLFAWIFGWHSGTFVIASGVDLWNL